MIQHRLLPVVLLAALPLALSGCERRIAAGPRPDPVAAAKIRQELAKGGEPAEKEKPSGEAADTKEPTAEAAGWGTLHAVFKYAGAAAPPEPIKVTKDPEVCAKHPLFDESLVVGSGGGLANAVLFLRSSKVPVHPDFAASSGAEVVMDNKDCRFNPHVQVMRTSQTLVLKNSDPVGHNTKANCFANPAFNVIIPAGGKSAQKLAAEEALPVTVGCNIHPWMAGILLVRKTPYAAASDKQGELTIEKLPAGQDLEFQLWHEKWGYLKKATVEGLKVDSSGRFKVKLEPDQKRDIVINVP